jgi:hypothetical protein
LIAVTTEVFDAFLPLFDMVLESLNDFNLLLDFILQVELATSLTLSIHGRQVRNVVLITPTARHEK